MAALRWLVLPFGTTSGPRIIIYGAGANGIEIYNAAGLAGRISATGGVEIFDPPQASYAQLISSQLKLATGDADELNPGTITAASIGAGGAYREHLELVSPGVDDTAAGENVQARAIVHVAGESEDGTVAPLVEVTGTGGRSPDLYLGLERVRILEGADRPMGVATLAAGTVTVNHSRVTANTRIFTARQAAGGVLGHLSIANVVAGTSFDIISSAGGDTSTVAYLLVEPS